MATASRLIERAYREAAIKALNSGGLSQAEYDEGLDRLNGFLASMFSAEIGQELHDWQFPATLRTAPLNANNLPLPFPQNLSIVNQTETPMEQADPTRSAYPPPNCRVLWGGTAPATLYLPQYPTDGARMEFVNVGSTATLSVLGNGRLVDGAATLTFAETSDPITLFYRADRGEWRPVAPLALGDESPLPAEFDDLLVAGTAIRLTALDEISPQSGTMFIYDRLLKRAQQRYRQPGHTAYDSAALRPSEQVNNLWYQSRPW